MRSISLYVYTDFMKTLVLLCLIRDEAWKAGWYPQESGVWKKLKFWFFIFMSFKNASAMSELTDSRSQA